MNKLHLQVLLSAVDKLTTPLKTVQAQVSKVSNAVKEAQSGLNKLKKQEKTIEQFKQLQSEINQSNQSLVNAREKANQLAKQYNATAAPTAKMRKEMEKAYREVHKLALKQKEQRQRLNGLRIKLKESGINTSKLASEQTKLKDRIEQANKSINKQQKALEKLNKKKRENDLYQKKVEKLKKHSDNLQNFGQKSLITGGSLLGTGYKMLQPAAEFEQSFSKVQALTRLDKVKDAKQIQALRQQALDLGASTAFSSSEVADAQSYLAMAGFTPEQIQASLSSVLNTALASGVSLDRVSDVASDISQGFKLPASEMGRVADVLTMTFTSSNTSLETLYETMKEGAPIMTSLGQSMETTAAMTGFLGNVGIKGSNAGTTLKNIGLNLIDNKHLDKLGVKVKDAAGNMRQIPEILAEIKKKTDNMGTAQRAAVINDIFGKIPVAGALELISQADGALQEYEKTIKNSAGAAEKAAATMADNLIGDLKSFRSAFEAINISLFDGQSSGLRQLTQEATQWLRKLNEWIKANPELTAQIIKWIGIFGAVMVVMGGLSLLASRALYPVWRLLLVFGKFTLGLKHFLPAISTTCKFLKGQLVSAITMVSRSLSLMGISSLTNPIFFVIAAIAVAAYVIYRNWDKVRAFFGGFWEGLKSGLAPVLEKFKPLGDLFGVVVGWIEKAVKWFTDLLSPVQSTSEDLESARSAGEKFGNATAKAIELILTPLNLLMDGIRWLSENMPSWDGIKNSVSNAWNSTKEGVSSAWQKAKSWAGLGEEVPAVNKWSGGYAGNGGKYQPKGIFHGGEYIMTKEATSRLGVPLLNALNYGKNAMLAAGLGVSVASAQPIKVDNRPPLSAKPQTSQMASQPMQVTININAQQGQSAVDIAKEVEKALMTLENQKQARARSALRDRE
ncbi:phage tail tape measure protein [Avibacterium paragallinarum]|uniref:phage tail tape measure protein n=1 Tax=Avibacterium paragallinarum TaxID=728 RepID=UPI003979C62C